MEGRLSAKVAVVTGATSGFGTAIARLFAAEGAALMLGGRRSDAGEALVREPRNGGADARFVAGDVGEERDAQALADCARDAHGRIDVLVLLCPLRAPLWAPRRGEQDMGGLLVQQSFRRNAAPQGQGDADT